MTSYNNINVTAVKIYFPREDPTQVHQTRVKPCPNKLTPHYYWYGGKRRGPGCPPQWVNALLSASGDLPRQPDVSPGQEHDTDKGQSISADSACHQSNSATDPYLDPKKGLSRSDDAYSESTFVDMDQKFVGATPDAFEETIDEAAEASVPNSQEDSGISTSYATPVSKPSRYSLRKTRHPPD